MRVLVCGGRDFDNLTWLMSVLDAMHEKHEIDWVIHGDARGADRMAGLWAARRCVSVHAYPADWARHGKAAGAIRNQDMIDYGKPDHVIAFPGGRGTADMVERAKRAGIAITQHVTPSSGDEALHRLSR